MHVFRIKALSLRADLIVSGILEELLSVIRGAASLFILFNFLIYPNQLNGYFIF